LRIRDSRLAHRIVPGQRVPGRLGHIYPRFPSRYKTAAFRRMADFSKKELPYLSVSRNSIRLFRANAAGVAPPSTG
jgi:hypothetical protein